MTLQVDFERRNTMYEPEALLSACGISLPPGADPNEISKKILADNFVGNCVMELLIKKFAPEAMATRHPLEKEALKKRLGLAEPEAPRVAWGISTHPISGKVIITAVCGSETMNWSGAVEDLPRLKFRGDTVPGDIALTYKLSVSSGPDPELEAARRDYGEREVAKAKHSYYESKTKDIILA
jgi:hypothetical protein